MTWFALDDQGAFHAKVVRAGNQAYGAWCRAGQWSSAQLTDGLIPAHVATTIAPVSVWVRLRAAGLVDPGGDDAYQIHDYLDYNPSRAEVLAERERKRQNTKNHRAKRKGVTGYTTDTSRLLTGKSPVSFPPVSRPDPDPDPVPDPKREIPPTPHGGATVHTEHDDGGQTILALPSPSPARRPGRPRATRTRCPASEALDAPSWAQERGIPSPAANPEVARFMDHHAAKGNLFADWSLAWKNWSSGRFVGGGAKLPTRGRFLQPDDCGIPTTPENGWDDQPFADLPTGMDR